MFLKDWTSLHQCQNLLVCIGGSAGAGGDGACTFVYVCVCVPWGMEGQSC